MGLMAAFMQYPTGSFRPIADSAILSELERMTKFFRVAVPILYVSFVCAWVFNLGGLGERMPFWVIPLAGILLLTAVLRFAPPPPRSSPLTRLERGMDAFALYGTIAGALVFGFSSGWVLGSPLHLGGTAKAGLLLAAVAVASGFIPGAWFSGRASGS